MESMTGSFSPNMETIDCGFFARDSIPERLETGKTTREQIDLCFQAAADDNWSIVFD